MQPFSTHTTNNPGNLRILLAVSGGIAAYKAAELVRLLRKHGADVRVVMTQSAQAFVSPLTFQALSGNPVHSDLLDSDEENAMGHINLARWANVMVIAPATANTIAKCAHGLANDLVSTLYLTATCPVAVAPSMNQAMWGKPITQDNIAGLLSQGVMVIGPDSGEQACGESGAGRMSEPEVICRQLIGIAKPQILAGLNVLVSAGPTREYLDPVRFISNRSSGKMGYAIALAAQAVGAKVTLVSGPVKLKPPTNIDVIAVETAAQMYDAIITRAEIHDIYIGTAAVADYTPTQMQLDKIKKHDEHKTVAFKKTQDILAAVANLTKPPFTVGFAAETTDLEHYANDKLIRKKLDMVAANWVGKAEGGFDSHQNALEVFWQTGKTSLSLKNKSELADELISLIALKYNEKNRI
jgi:phosphopantothenoylcysteine decarboxylase / phosphopantothenate---cysteine ligase